MSRLVIRVRDSSFVIESSVHRRVLVSTNDMFDGGIIFEQLVKNGITDVEVITVPVEKKSDTRIILRELIRAAEEGRPLSEKTLSLPTTFNIDFEELDRANLVVILDGKAIFVVKDCEKINKMARLMDFSVEEIPNVSVLGTSLN